MHGMQLGGGVVHSHFSLVRMCWPLLVFG